MRERPHNQEMGHWGSAVNPRFRPWYAWKVADTTQEMEKRKDLLVSKALLVLDEGMVGAQSPREVANIVLLRFGIRKHLF